MASIFGSLPVSDTHLDVYKRQFHVLGQRLRLIQILRQSLVLNGLHFAECGIVHVGRADEIQHVGDVDLNAALLENVIKLFGLLLRGRCV